MGFFSRRRPTRVVQSSGEALTAAARQLNPTPEGEKAEKGRTPSERQAKAWDFYDEIGEVRFAARFMGDAFARLRLFAAVQPDPFSAPIPIVEDPDSDAGYNSQEATLALNAMASLWSPEGGQAEIQRRIGVNLFVPGEVYVVGRPAGEDMQRWDAYSTEELRQRDKKWQLRSRRNTTEGVELEEDAVVLRLWRPHPRWSDEADSPILTATTILEELLLSTRSVQGAMRSRLASAGMLVLPNSMRDTPAKSTESETKGHETDQVTSDLIQVASAAISDPKSAAAVVPVIQFMDDDLWKDFDANKLVQWDHEIDKVAAETRAELIRRFATAIDLPSEILTGMGDVNHWGQWFLDDDLFKSHVEPAAILMDSGLASKYLQPLMALAGVEDVGRFLIWHDATALVSNPNQADHAVTAHDKMLISDDRARRDLGYGDDDAPDDAEITKRIAIASALAGRAPAAIPAGDENVDEQPPGGEETATIDAVSFAVDENLAHLGPDLAEMDRSLMVTVHQAADAAMHRALERANARIRTLALRDSVTRGLLEQVSNASLQVAPTLGPAHVNRLTAGTELVDDAAFLGMLARYDSRTERTSDEVLLAAQKAGELSDIEADQLRAEFAGEREAGRQILLAGLLGLSADLLFRPEPLGPPGETDGSLVPVGLVRDSLKRAGGGGEDAVSMLTGRLTRQSFSQAGITFARYRWRYGDAAARLTPFEPHRRLDGVTFANPSDDRLGNASFSWPGVSHYAPGDHRGCACLWEWTNPQVADASQLPPAIPAKGVASPARRKR